MNADSLKLLNLSDLASIIHKWQKAKSVASYIVHPFPSAKQGTQ